MYSTLKEPISNALRWHYVAKKSAKLMAPNQQIDPNSVLQIATLTPACEYVRGSGLYTPYVAVMRRSRSRAGVLVQLPPLSSTSYLSCIIETSCKQTLLLAFLRSAQAAEHNTMHFCFHCILYCNILPRHASVQGLDRHLQPANALFRSLQTASEVLQETDIQVSHKLCSPSLVLMARSRCNCQKL